MSADLSFQLTRRHALMATAATFAPLGLNALAAPPATQGPQALKPGRDQSFDQDWRFVRGVVVGGESLGLDDGAWRRIDLPHDWSIEDAPVQAGSGRLGPFDPKAVGGGATAFTLGGEGWYRKHFTSEGLAPGAQVRVTFGGVCVESDAWLNGVHLGQHVHGYTPFHYDLTPHLRPGANVLTVRARNLGRNSRWYAGSGLYRAVTLDVTPTATTIAPWGVAVSTRRISDDAAELDVAVRLDQVPAGATVTSRARADDGRVVAETTSAAADAVSHHLRIKSARLWSPNSPALYMLETVVTHDGKVLDRVVTPFGVRIVTFSAQDGLRINGQTTKLRGGCVHHDNGLLGAAAHPDAEDRRVRLLRARGYNAVRSSHYPASRAFAEACDRHGMLLIMEAFDMWRSPKTPDDYSNHFAEHWKSDIDAMVLSARNHPSVIMWSIGNEVPHRATPEGVRTAWELTNQVHRLDPTRPVTAGVNGFNGRPIIADAQTARRGAEGQTDEAACAFLDVVGYNYKLDRYDLDHQRYPNRVLYGSESFPREMFDAWAYIDEHSHVVGDFVWSAIDYLGEAGCANVTRSTSKFPAMSMPDWPWIISNCGDLDILGQQKPSSLARDVVWDVSPIEMAVQRPLADGEIEHVNQWGWSDELPCWTWPGHEGRGVKVRIYTKGDRVELKLNGKTVAVYDRQAGDTLRMELETAYAPGVLSATAYAKGKAIGARTLQTTAAPTGLKLSPEVRRTVARRGALVFVLICVVDGDGKTVLDQVRKVDLTVSGPAQLVGFGGAAPLATGSYQSPQAQTFNGQVLAVLRSDGRVGQVKVQARSAGLAGGSTSIAFSAR